MTSRQDRKRRASWIGVNAYGVFIATLAVLLSLRFFIEPSASASPLGAVGYLGYGLSGLGLLWSYWRTRLDFEVFASVLLLASNVAILGGRAMGEGSPTYWDVILSVALGVAVVARVMALLRGGTFVLPRWRRGKH